MSHLSVELNPVVDFIERKYKIKLSPYQRITAMKYYSLKKGRLDINFKDKKNINNFLIRNKTNYVTDKDIKIIQDLNLFLFEDKKIKSVELRNDILINILYRGLNPISSTDTDRLSRVIKGVINEDFIKSKVSGLYNLEYDTDFINKINNEYIRKDEKKIYKQLYLYSPIDFVDNDDYLVEHKTLSKRDTINDIKKENLYVPFDNLQKLIFNKLVSDKPLKIIIQDKEDKLIKYSIDFNFKNENRRDIFDRIKNNYKNTINPITDNNVITNNKELTDLFINEIEEQDIFYTSFKSSATDRNASNNYYISIPINLFEDILYDEEN